MDWTRPDEQAGPRILILGGGFAGVYTGFALQRALGDQPAEIGIVNRENFFVFYPLLPEVISGTIETEHVLTPIRYVVPRATLYVGEVVSVDLAQRRVEIRHGLYRHRQKPLTLFYDHLVLALGGIPNTTPVPGLAENAFDVQRLSQAFALRNHLIDTLEQADIETNPLEKRRLLTFVVVGGGANGVEVAAEIQGLVYEATKRYRHIEPDDLHVVIVHGGPRLLPDLNERLSRYAARLLQERGVDIRFNTRVVRVEREAVYLSDGSVIPTETVVGSVGVRPNPLVREFGLPLDPSGRILVEETLQVQGHPNVWALGDNALVIDPYTGRPYPQTAQHAVREARRVAGNIVAALRGEPLKPIRYRTLGYMVALGPRRAAVQLRGLTFSGVLAWWMFRTYYLAQIPRWEKRLRITIDWTLDLLFPPVLVQLKVGQPAPMAAPEPEAAREGR